MGGITGDGDIDGNGLRFGREKQRGGRILCYQSSVTLLAINRGPHFSTLDRRLMRPSGPSLFVEKFCPTQLLRAPGRTRSQSRPLISLM